MSLNRQTKTFGTTHMSDLEFTHSGRFGSDRHCALPIDHSTSSAAHLARVVPERCGSQRCRRPERTCSVPHNANPPPLIPRLRLWQPPKLPNMETAAATVSRKRASRRTQVNVYGERNRRAQKGRAPLNFGVSFFFFDRMWRLLELSFHDERFGAACTVRHG